MTFQTATTKSDIRASGFGLRDVVRDKVYAVAFLASGPAINRGPLNELD